MLPRRTRARWTQPVATSIFSVLAMIVTTACSSAEPVSATTAPAERVTPTTETIAAEVLELPVRDGPPRETTGTVPHIQLDAEPVPAVDAELRRRVFQLPGVENLASDRSLPGARGLAFSDAASLTRADVIAGSREFAHIHPDGSLHVWLPVDSAIEVEEKKWGELHPWVERDGFWDGVVMVYTPETPDELEVTIQIIIDGYNFVTGADVDPTDIP